MRRRAGNILMGLSVAISIALGVLWARSYGASDGLSWRSVSGEAQPAKVRTLFVYSGRGGIEVGVGREQIYTPPQIPVPRGLGYESSASPPAPGQMPMELGWRKSALGFGLEHAWSTPAGLFNLAGLPGLGPMFVPAPLGRRESTRAVWVPHWFAVLLFGVPPARGIYRWARSRRRKKQGLCVGCGYDLRGSSDKCPECGETIGKPTGEAPVPL